jgi:hypothetical protein
VLESVHADAEPPELRRADGRTTQRGAVVACYYALAYLGFAAPYLAAGLGAASGQVGAFGVLAGIAIVIAGETAGYGLRRSRADRAPDPPVLCEAGTTGTRT